MSTAKEGVGELLTKGATRFSKMLTFTGRDLACLKIKMIHPNIMAKSLEFNSKSTKKSLINKNKGEGHLANAKLRCQRRERLCAKGL